MKKYKKKLLKEQLKDAGYTLKLYVENNKFIVSFVSWGSKLSEVYKEFDDKSSALKEYMSIITKVTKEFKKV